MKDPRYMKIAKLAELRELADGAGERYTAHAYGAEAVKLLRDKPEDAITLFVGSDEICFGCGKATVTVRPNLAHGFALDIQGTEDTAEIGEGFSKWLRERV